MARTDHLERQVELVADLDFALPDLRPIVGTVRLPDQALRTTYFDTPDLRLWGRGITLRHRDGEGGDGGVWTLKLPEDGTGAALERTELSWPGARRQVPGEAEVLLKGVVRRSALREVVQLESVRKRLKLGSSLGEIDDDVVTVKSGSRKGYIFRQIELEFGNDSPAAASDLAVIDAVLDALRRAGAHADGQQKFAKALDLSAAATTSELIAGKRASIRSAVELSTTSALDRLLDHDVLLRMTPGAPPRHSVHLARVATRRLRSDLKTFRQFLDPVWLQHTTTELRWFGTILGQVRDIDVLSERLDSWNAEGQIEQDGRSELTTVLDRQRQQANAELGRALESDRYLVLLEHLASAASLPPLRLPDEATARAADVFPSLVRHQYRAVRKRVRQRGQHPEDAQLHRIRIGAKQLRYAAEAAAPFVGKPVRRIGKRAEHLQTVLGEHHDAVAAEAWLRQAAEETGSPMAGIVAGCLVAEAREQKAKREKHWKHIWSELHRDTRWLYP